MIKIGFGERDKVLVPIKFKPRKWAALGGKDIFLVDTGADFSAISKNTLYKLGYDYNWIKDNLIRVEGRVGTAIHRYGEEGIEAPYIQLPLIKVLGREIRNFPFRLIESKEADFNNLLGRDLLSGFNYCFNNDEKAFSAEQTKNFAPARSFWGGLEIW
ncbi:MAG: retroviral-like aspartic protease family protein [Clostridiales bacterium]|jgi:predicted aspartyl protease|nr:retroviral-like aspartic protease family protein [Clostridiales bacterium]